MSRAYLSLGGNMGDSGAYLRQARAGLDSDACRVTAASSLYRTGAWGKTEQPDFLNAVLAVETSLIPEALLARCQALEAAAGRRRLEHWGSRTLDVDIIAYLGQRRATPRLTLPHPWYGQRLFVLLPLLEIAGDIELEPGQPLSVLVAHCGQEQRVEKLPPDQQWE